MTAIKDDPVALGVRCAPPVGIPRFDRFKMAMRFDNATGAAQSLQQHWGWLLLVATLQILGGALAVAMPVAASFAAVGVIAALLIVTGFLQLIHAFQMKAWPRSAWYGLGAALYAAVGVLLILHPIGGVLALAVLIAVLLIAEGALRTAFGAVVRPLAGWLWLAAAGVSSMVVGVFLLIGWPATALWLTGLLLGINLLMTGIMNAAFAISARSALPGPLPA